MSGDPPNLEKTRPEFDRSRTVTRGILIALIVIGHNKVFHNSYYAAYVVLYSFHVAAFMIIPFLYDPRPLETKKLVDLFTRYMVPFFITTIFYAAIYLIVEIPKNFDRVSDWTAELAGALTLANAYFIKQATGFEMLWFLPAFTVLTCLHTMIYAATRTVRGWVLVLAVVAHGCVGLLPAEAIRWIPFSAYISLYVLAPGLVLSAFRHRIERFRRPHFVAIGLVFLAACLVQYHQSATIILSDFTVFSLETPFRLILTDVQMLTGTLMCIGIARELRTSALLNTLGMLSMQVYLIHGLIGYAIYRLALPLDLPVPVAFLATFALTLGASYAVAVLATRSRTLRWIFPRGFDEFVLMVKGMPRSTGPRPTR